MGEFLSAWFAFLLFVSCVVAFVCGQTLGRGAPYLIVFRVAGAVAFAAYSFGQIPNAIWCDSGGDGRSAYSVGSARARSILRSGMSQIRATTV